MMQVMRDIGGVELPESLIKTVGGSTSDNGATESPPPGAGPSATSRGKAPE